MKWVKQLINLLTILTSSKITIELNILKTDCNPFKLLSSVSTVTLGTWNMIYFSASGKFAK